MKEKLMLNDKTFLTESAAAFQKRIQNYDPILYRYDAFPGQITEEDISITMLVHRETMEDFYLKISYLIDNWGTNPKQGRKDTLLFLAIEFGLIELVKLVLEKGFDPNRPSSSYNALYICLIFHTYQEESVRKEILILLLQYNVSFLNIHSQKPKKDYDVGDLLKEIKKTEYTSFFENHYHMMNEKQKREWKAVRLKHLLQ